MTSSPTPLELYLRHRRAFEIVLWVAAACVEAGANTATVAMDHQREHLSFAGWEPAVWEFTSCLTILALVPAVLAVERRFPFRFGCWGRSLRIHAFATLPFSLLHVGVMVALRKLAYLSLGDHYDFGSAPRELLYEYLKDCRTYATIIGSLYVYRFLLLQLQGEAHLLSPPEHVPLAPEERPERFLVRKRGKEFLVAATDIEYLEASGNYVNLHVRGRRYPLRSTMGALEPRLDPKRFQRVHRRYIINLDQLVEIGPLDTGDARLVMKDGTQVPCSRRYREALRIRGA